LMLGMAGSASKGTKIIIPSLALIAALSVLPSKRRIVYGPGLDNYPPEHPEWYGETLSELFDHVINGRLSPRIASTVPFVDVASAHTALESGEVSGKIVLVTDAYAHSKFNKEIVRSDTADAAHLQPG